MSQLSPMSITQLCNAPDIDHRPCESDLNSNPRSTCINPADPDVQIAAAALGDMARAQRPVALPPLVHQSSAPSTGHSSPIPTPTSSSVSTQRFSFSSDSTVDDDYKPKRQQHFIQRVSTIPVVHNAIRVYENSKSSNRVLKYSAEMVESFAGPIVNAVDKWGSRQLDKFEQRHPDYSSTREDDMTTAATTALARASLEDDRESMRHRRRDEESTHAIKSASSSRSVSRSTSPHRPYSLSQKSTKPRSGQSRWQRIVVHAGSAAGTTAAVVSEESMKCLRYCLSWLQYAAQHIDQQMNILRNFLASIASGTDASQTNHTTTVSTPSSATSSTIAAVKREIVETLRKVVEVISKYAGVGLPEQAKRSVRGFILALPSRWAMLNTSTTATPTGSPRLGPHTPSHVHEASIKLLNFGGESIEMLQSVAVVFSDTIERAELWLERLRVVGVSGSHVRRQPESHELSQIKDASPPALASKPTPDHEVASPDRMDISD